MLHIERCVILKYFSILNSKHKILHYFKVSVQIFFKHHHFLFETEPHVTYTRQVSLSSDLPVFIF